MSERLPSNQSYTLFILNQFGKGSRDNVWKKRYSLGLSFMREVSGCASAYQKLRLQKVSFKIRQLWYFWTSHSGFPQLWLIVTPKFTPRIHFPIKFSFKLLWVCNSETNLKFDQICRWSNNRPMFIWNVFQSHQMAFSFLKYHLSFQRYSGFCLKTDDVTNRLSTKINRKNQEYLGKHWSDAVQTWHQ